MAKLNWQDLAARPYATIIDFARRLDSQIRALLSDIDRRPPRESFHFGISNVGTNTTDQPVFAAGYGLEYLIMNDAFIYGVAVTVSETRTAGTMTIDFTVDGAVVASIVIDGSNPDDNYELFTREDLTYAVLEGSKLGCLMTLSGWDPIFSDVVASVLVGYT